MGSVPHPVDEKPTEIPDHSLLLAGTGFAIPDGLPMRTEIPQEYIAKASPSLSIRCRALVTAAPKILVWVEDRTSTINNWDGYPSSLLSSSLSRDIAHQESSATPGDDGDLPTLVPPSATSGGKALPIVTGGDSPVQTPPTRESDGPSNNAGGDSTGPSGGSSNNNELPDIGSEQSDPTDGSSSLNDSSGSGSGASNNGANESSSGTDSESPNDSPSLQSPITIDGIPLTPINSHLVVGNQTLDPGNAITISGKTISLDPSGTAVVVGSSTIPLPVPIITPPPVFTIGGSTVTAASGSVFVVNGQTLTPGGVITINNTPVSFGSSQVVIGSSTQALGTGSISTGGATNTMPGMKGYIIWLILLTLYIT